MSDKGKDFWEIVAIIAILLAFMGLFYVVLVAVVKEFARP